MECDILIIGGGAAGLTAGIYAARAGMNTIVCEKTFAGGQIVNSENVENYPGYSSISGVDLAMRMLEQAEHAGVKMLYDSVTGIDDVGDKIVHTEHNGDIRTKTVILCMGASPRQLGIEKEVRYIGKGVSYCAFCDGAFYKDKTVAVIGGGNTAVGDAVYLSKFASKVYLVHRRDSFRAAKAELDKLTVNNNVEILTNSVVSDIVGVERVSGIKLTDTVTGEDSEIAIDGLFVAIGNLPSGQDILRDLERDTGGYIVTDGEMRTNIDGIYAAGDVRAKDIRQLVTATSDGAIAATSALNYIYYGKR